VVKDVLVAGEDVGLRKKEEAQVKPDARNNIQNNNVRFIPRYISMSEDCKWAT